MPAKIRPVVLRVERGRVWLYFENTGRWSMDIAAFPSGIKEGDRVDIKIIPRDEFTKEESQAIGSGNVRR